MDLSRPSNSPALIVADLFHPVDDLALECFLDGEVRHGAGRRRAVPMLFSRRTQDHISGIDLFHRTSPALHEAATGPHDARLTERMCMPCRAGPRLASPPRTLASPAAP